MDGTGEVFLRLDGDWVGVSAPRQPVTRRVRREVVEVVVHPRWTAFGLGEVRLSCGHRELVDWRKGSPPRTATCSACTGSYAGPEGRRYT